MRGQSWNDPTLETTGRVRGTRTERTRTFFNVRPLAAIACLLARYATQTNPKPATRSMPNTNLSPPLFPQFQLQGWQRSPRDLHAVRFAGAERWESGERASRDDFSRLNRRCPG